MADEMNDTVQVKWNELGFYDGEHTKNRKIFCTGDVIDVNPMDT